MPSYAQGRMDQRSVTAQDIENTLRGGVCRPGEWNAQHAEWRYRFETSKFVVVVAFDEVESCIIVTTWRRNP